jgi:hypothetical protein
VAIATRLVVDELLMVTIFRSVRLLVLRNLASQSDQDSWEMRAREIREMVLDAWPEGSKPGRDTWEFRFIRTCAVFWLVSWPMLKGRFTLDEIDGWSTKLVRAVAVSSQRWADAGADPGGLRGRAGGDPGHYRHQQGTGDPGPGAHRRGARAAP